MNRIVIFFFLLVSGTPLFSQQTISLEQAIQLAVAKNYNVRIAYNDFEKSDVQHQVGNAGMLPQVTATGAYSRNYNNLEIGRGTNQVPTGWIKGRSYNGFLNLKQTLFDGGNMFRLYDKLGLGKDLQGYKKKQTIENTISSVVSTYLSVCRSKQLVAINKEAIKLSTQRLEIADSRRKAGAATVMEALTAKVDVAKDSSQLLANENNLTQNRRQLLYLLAMNQDELIRVNEDIVLAEISPDSLIKQVTASNTLIKQAKMGQSISELDYQVYKGSRLPVISLSARGGYSNSVSPFNFNSLTKGYYSGVDLNASFNVFNGNKTNIQQQVSKLELLNKDIQLEDVTQRIVKDAKNSQSAYQTRLRQYQFETQNLATFQKNFELTEQAYKLGRTTPIQLREAQINLLEAKRRIYEAKLNIKLEEIDLLRLSGHLISVN
ncbi:MAG: TolC family protein [Cyclobacteriaceae bacterium]